jgi:hypothetical protein
MRVMTEGWKDHLPTEEITPSRICVRACRRIVHTQMKSPRISLLCRPVREVLRQSAIGVRAALRRSPPRMTILAPILTCEHAYDDDEADERQKSQDEEGGH